jgi:membrane protein DedA with SNARE-associated domain
VSFELIIARYGLAAVALGAGFEGETAVLAGGVLARQGLLPLAGVACAAGIGSFLADQGFFLIGRQFRDRAYVRQALAKPMAHRAIALLERHPNGFILAIRFLYGIRTLSPIAVGASHISRFRFMALNALAAAVWAVLFSTIGYKIGDELHELFNRVHPYTRGLLIAFAGVFVLLLVVRLMCRRYHRRAALRVTDNPFPAASQP